ncbi:MAG: nucleotide exchange factor GrpE [Stackebrandtia sp.]
MSTRSERRRKKHASGDVPPKRVAGGATPKRGKPTPTELREALGNAESGTKRLEKSLASQREQTERLLERLSDYDFHLAVLTALTDVVDVVDRVAADEERDADSLRAEVRKISGRLSGALNGIADMEVIGGVGETADPTIHKVESVRDVPGIPPDVVVKVVERGIRYRGDVIRPASVIVSSGRETRQ